ncbi:capsular polysaccharide synthesis protein [Sphaerochaeta sp. PS]|uniref:capsular polysaccharide synthesis protein n=1 Tax=Sphaerochaeta sp. PS TaxID=3076336 RepID=UPI0028A31B10|nr:capsular polysaccharide synthesis protein [Sphaerochaeta sp. PS]MDT4762163.1 capsular polysaccharide synthesis protein [Sphaerochaeta sp. PS]
MKIDGGVSNMGRQHNVLYRKEFGFVLQTHARFLKICKKFTKGYLKEQIYDRDHALKGAWLRSHFSDTISSLVAQYYATGSSSLAKPSKKYIWMFWWQANHQELPVIRTCIDSIKKHMPDDAELIILTKDNLAEYCSIPDHIYKKLETGIITLTHFSDIVRVTALADRGGLWLDATIFATADFSYAFEGPFWSIKKPGSTHKFVPRGRWTIYAIGSEKNSIIFYLMKELFSQYWAHYNVMLDYFLVDLFMNFLYENVEEVKTLIDGVQPNNIQVLGMQGSLQDFWNPSLVDGLMKDTQLFKLSWKQQVPVTIDEKMTLYGWFLSQDTAKIF